MDKIEEWMNRAMKVATPQKTKETSNKKDQGEKKSFFTKRKKHKKPQHAHKKADAGKKPHVHKKAHAGKKPHAGHMAKPKAKKKLTRPTKKVGPSKILKGKLKIVPLGGLDEVGKNMTAFEYEDDIVIIDMGFEFPGEDMFGIDYVIPDVSYLEENKKRIRGVLLSHGHLDHIGGIPYILPKLDFPPVYGAKLTLGIVEQRTKEFKQEKETKLRVIDPDQPLKLGKFTCHFFRVAHSIPDALGIVLETPIGKIVHTGDFKFDETPPRNMKKADIHKMEALGKENVLALFCESTNATKPGHTMSEKDVGEALDVVIGKCPGRALVASFSSQIGRVQQIIDGAVKHNRKIFVSGRSMENNIETASKLGYINFPKDHINNIKKLKNTNLPDNEILIITTGSQGEPLSALSRIARNEHSHIRIKKKDTIILSSSPIPGNEKAIYKVINNLCILGAEVIHNKMEDIHTSGHGYQDELKRMIKTINAQYLIPIHGEYYMRHALAKLAKEECGVPENRIIMIENGDVLLADKEGVRKSKETIETKYILIDGRGEGYIGSNVQSEREILSQNGTLIVLLHTSKKSGKLQKRPDIVSRGFIYMHETNEIMEDIKKVAGDAYRKIRDKNPNAGRKDIKKYIRQTVDKYTHSQLERRPLIVPLIIEN